MAARAGGRADGRDFICWAWMDGWNRCLSHGFMPGIILGFWDVAMPTKSLLLLFCPSPSPATRSPLRERDFHQDSRRRGRQFTKAPTPPWPGPARDSCINAAAWHWHAGLRALPLVPLHWCRGVTDLPSKLPPPHLNRTVTHAKFRSYWNWKFS